MVKTNLIITNPHSGQTMIFRKTAMDTNGALLEIESFNPPGAPKEPEHVHPKQESSAEVISGKVHFSINGTIQIVGPGEKVVIPPGVPHFFWNEGPEEAHSIQRFSPALTIETFFRTYFALARDGKLNKKGTANLFLMTRLLLYHQSDIRLTKPPWAVQKLLFTPLKPIAILLGYKKEYS
ncbi:cupin domain-containing protein [Planomicrobium sp. CPCC 101110]|uniref:cupin domain-containing protein n=1 Tax=Planomicrobium sp. CPCC 101110 TaxID=2599619 RepID=UPI0011B6D21F|nr:cupin domain-containing protein [Planomicrobium sp. CPCC 101110]TWT25939.1 cupin domain-containing protein [Planomicrobium sp. CPCC 101110]